MNLYWEYSWQVLHFVDVLWSNFDGHTTDAREVVVQAKLSRWMTVVDAENSGLIETNDNLNEVSITLLGALIMHRYQEVKEEERARTTAEIELSGH